MLNKFMLGIALLGWFTLCIAIPWGIVSDVEGVTLAGAIAGVALGIIMIPAPYGIYKLFSSL